MAVPGRRLKTAVDVAFDAAYEELERELQQGVPPAPRPSPFLGLAPPWPRPQPPAPPAQTAAALGFGWPPRAGWQPVAALPPIQPALAPPPSLLPLPPRPPVPLLRATELGRGKLAPYQPPAAPRLAPPPPSPSLPPSPAPPASQPRASAAAQAQPHSASPSEKPAPPPSRAAATRAARRAAAEAAGPAAPAAPPAVVPNVTPPPPPAGPPVECCPICWEGIYASGEGQQPLAPDRELCELRPCQHVFHAGCVLTWLPQQNTCPACRGRVTGRWGPSSRLSAVPFSDAFRTQQLRVGGAQPYDDTLCQVCHDGGQEHLMLLCDGCDRGFHTHCVQLRVVPTGAFHCRRCRRREEAERMAAMLADDESD